MSILHSMAVSVSHVEHTKYEHLPQYGSKCILNMSIYHSMAVSVSQVEHTKYEHLPQYGGKCITGGSG